MLICSERVESWFVYQWSRSYHLHASLPFTSVKFCSLVWTTPNRTCSSTSRMMATSRARLHCFIAACKSHVAASSQPLCKTKDSHVQLRTNIINSWWLDTSSIFFQNENKQMKQQNLHLHSFEFCARAWREEEREKVCVVYFGRKRSRLLCWRNAWLPR